MKFRTIFGFALVAAAFAMESSTPSTFGQAGAEDPLLAPLVEDLTRQQTSILENQAKIDEKLAAISEDLRVARIFVGRGGGKGGGK